LKGAGSNGKVTWAIILPWLKTSKCAAVFHFKFVSPGLMSWFQVCFETVHETELVCAAHTDRRQQKRQSQHLVFERIYLNSWFEFVPTDHDYRGPVVSRPEECLYMRLSNVSSTLYRFQQNSRSELRRNASSSFKRDNDTVHSVKLKNPARRSVIQFLAGSTMEPCLALHQSDFNFAPHFCGGIIE